jgi:hypothetical protein
MLPFDDRQIGLETLGVARWANERVTLLARPLV